jgi:hypothetical protein
VIQIREEWILFRSAGTNWQCILEHSLGLVVDWIIKATVNSSLQGFIHHLKRHNTIKN